MRKIDLTPDQQILFSANFDRQTYEEAKAPIQKAVDESKEFMELWEKLSPRRRDIEYGDDCTIMWCEVELDTSRMRTDASYVGLCFYICWNEESNTGKIDSVALYSNEISKEYYADLLCYMNPDTCEITKWVYEA